MRRDMTASQIREQTMEEHGDLVRIDQELATVIRGMANRLIHGEAQWSVDTEYTEFLGAQGLTMIATVELACEGFYRDAYTTVRTALEAYLLFHLITLCYKYEFTYRVRRSRTDPDLKSALARFEAEIRSKPERNLVSLKRVGTDRLVAIRRGLDVVDSDQKPTGRMISFYHSAWQQYDANEHHLGNLQRYLEREWAVSRVRRVPDPRHAQFYRDYFTFSGLLEKLRLNGIVNKGTSARLAVHYNFLSGFTHTTKRAIERLVNVQRYHDGTVHRSYSHYHSELALLYVCHISAMFLRVMLRYLAKWKVGVENLERIEELVLEAERR